MAGKTDTKDTADSTQAEVDAAVAVVLLLVAAWGLRLGRRTPPGCTRAYRTLRAPPRAVATRLNARVRAGAPPAIRGSRVRVRIVRVVLP